MAGSEICAIYVCVASEICVCRCVCRVNLCVCRVNLRVCRVNLRVCRVNLRVCRVNVVCMSCKIG